MDISHEYSDTTKNLDYAVEQLKELSYEGRPITVSSLNTLMSAAAERGDIDRVLQFLQQFERSGIVPNSDTYSFAFESLGKNVRKGRRRNPVSKDHKEACLVAAESFLAKMDEQGIAPTHHIIREYVEMLCLLGEVDTATIILKEAATENGLVTSKSIYRVAMANAKVLHRFDIAREIAQLLDSIDREERFYTQGLGSREYEPVLSDNSAPVNEPEQIDNAYDEWDHGVNGNGFQNAINGEPEVEFVQADPIAPYPNQERTS
jgi:pentatricopeptide repeat protein